MSLVLMAVPGPPLVDDTTSAKIADVMGMGFAGTVFIGTDDCRADDEAMSARGVEFTEPPHETPYGIDSGFRDPSGNSVRPHPGRVPHLTGGPPPPHRRQRRSTARRPPERRDHFGNVVLSRTAALVGSLPWH